MSLNLSMLDDAAVAKVAAAGSAMAALAPLSQFEEDPANPRFEEDPGAFAAFVADVGARGILQPIIVRRLDNGRLRIRCGARRYRAAVQLGLTYAPYVVTDDPRQFDDYSQVAENQQRRRLQPLEMATFIHKKVEEGESKRQIADRLGIDPAAVTQLLVLAASPPPFLMELYHSRRCRSPIQLYRLRLLWNIDSVLVERHCADAGEINGVMLEELNRVLAERCEGKVVEQSDNNSTALQPTDLGVPTAPEYRGSGFANEVKAQRPQSKKAAASARKGRPVTAWPQIIGTVEGREVVLLPELVASSEGTVIVQDIGTSANREIALDAIRLTRFVRSPC